MDKDYKRVRRAVWAKETFEGFTHAIVNLFILTWFWYGMTQLNIQNMEIVLPALFLGWTGAFVVSEAQIIWREVGHRGFAVFRSLIAIVSYVVIWWIINLLVFSNTLIIDYAMTVVSVVAALTYIINAMLAKSASKKADVFFVNYQSQLEKAQYEKIFYKQLHRIQKADKDLVQNEPDLDVSDVDGSKSVDESQMAVGELVDGLVDSEGHALNPADATEKNADIDVVEQSDSVETDDLSEVQVEEIESAENTVPKISIAYHTDEPKQEVSLPVTQTTSGEVAVFSISEEDFNVLSGNKD